MPVCVHETHACLICRGFLLPPVVLPCDHRVCKECFDGILEWSNMECPFCRKRLNSWARRAKGKVVDRALQAKIMKHYGVTVEEAVELEIIVTKMMPPPHNPSQSVKDGSTNDTEAVHKQQQQLEDALAPPPVRVAAPGEVKAEYEAELARVRQQRVEEDQKLQLASEALIQRLTTLEQQREAEERRRQELQDRRLAMELHEQYGGIDTLSHTGEDAMPQGEQSVCSTDDTITSAPSPVSHVVTLSQSPTSDQTRQAQSIDLFATTAMGEQDDTTPSLGSRVTNSRLISHANSSSSKGSEAHASTQRQLYIELDDDDDVLQVRDVRRNGNARGSDLQSDKATQLEMQRAPMPSISAPKPLRRKKGNSKFNAKINSKAGRAGRFSKALARSSSASERPSASERRRVIRMRNIRSFMLQSMSASVPQTTPTTTTTMSSSSSSLNSSLRPPASASFSTPQLVSSVVHTSLSPTGASIAQASCANSSKHQANVKSIPCPLCFTRFTCMATLESHASVCGLQPVT
eukprot:m.68456 g.68456  ORF g.68456 m.68456 type:complete len:520 (-) comp12199_c0_seq2:118-1677(-)